MRFTFLGTGTSSGIPVIGCACEVCTSDDARDARLRTSACLEFTDAGGQDRTILIDAGPDLRQQVLRHGMSRLDAILFTHNHVDHTWGLDEVRRFNVVQEAPIDVYGDARTMRDLRRVYAHIFDRHLNVQKSFVADLIAHEIDLQPFDLYGVRFTPIRLLHGRLPVLGFRIDADAPWAPLAYCTDVSAIPPESWSILDGVETLVLDALRRRHHPTHFTLDQAVDAASRIGAPRTLLIHMTHDLGHVATNEELPEGIELAWDGLTLS
ncbi:MAG: MBL fold metallo-hydrolase [Phycisphaerales bacterium]|nr:MBL fold metallo-hydrolase [Phycisphaerales bacterium]